MTRAPEISTVPARQVYFDTARRRPNVGSVARARGSRAALSGGAAPSDLKVGSIRGREERGGSPTRLAKAVPRVLKNRSLDINPA
jgi:hypothetical protein